MSELRTDKLTGRSVIIAENRALRPNEFAELTSTGRLISGSVSPSEAGRRVCPFCPGQEHLTPPAVHEVIDATGKWQIRVVPNKYPAVTLPDDLSNANSNEPKHSTSLTASTSATAVGAQEVIIETARHVDRMSALSMSELRDVLQTYAARLNHWREDRRFGYGLVFKNQGPLAGASLAHLHSQFIALPTVPNAVEAELRRAKDAYRQDRCCPYCRLLRARGVFRTAAGGCPRRPGRRAPRRDPAGRIDCAGRRL
jgi:UDPglucose--hexose-1-phosphate uridylyltransferase